MIDNPSWQHFATHDESEYPELWQGVRGYWAPCLGPSGTRLHDVSGRNNWGTLTNMDAATDWVVDAGRYALDFDGSNDTVVFDSPVNIGTNDATFSFWARLPNQVRYGNLFSNRNPAPPFNQWTITQGNVTTAGQSNVGKTIGIFIYRGVGSLTDPGFVQNYATTNSVIDGNLHHFAIVRKNLNPIRIFVDGVSVPVTAIVDGQTNLNADITTPFQISLFGGLLGNFSEFMISLRSYSPNEILQLYQIGPGGMLTPRRRRRAYFAGVSGLRRRLLLTGQV